MAQFLLKLGFPLLPLPAEPLLEPHTRQPAAYHPGLGELQTTNLRAQIQHHARQHLEQLEHWLIALFRQNQQIVKRCDRILILTAV